MKPSANVPVVKDLVLLGGGHSHVEVLRSFGMKPMPGVKVTLITRDVHTPYSGMLPGYVSGFYSIDECHIDLAGLATFSGATMVNDEAISIDPESRRVRFQHRPSLPYDVLSVDIGITPGASQIPGASDNATPVKPISRLVHNLDEVLAMASTKKVKVAVVGGGAGGVELIMSLRTRMDTELDNSGNPMSNSCELTLITRGKILSSLPRKARDIFLRETARKNVTVIEDCGGVASVGSDKLHLKNGNFVEYDICWWCTDASAAPWIRDTGLATDEDGFIAINSYLQSESHEDVFAAGDVASCAAHPRPKAGVFAVRQGPPLTENLRLRLAGQALLPFVPQSTFLTLVTTGEKYCVGSKAGWCMEGAWLWQMKDRIDRKFMNKYSVDLPTMAIGDKELPAVAASSDAEALAAIVGAQKMRCGGCGAKVGATTLSRVLKRLIDDGFVASPEDSGLLIGLDAPDDAAVVRSAGPGMVNIRTVDFFRDFIGDPFVFGRVAANHALGDCHAMGADPRTALAIAVVPHGPPSKVEETLFQMMAGALQVLQEAGCALAGGHSGEGLELALGFAVDGVAKEEAIIRKAALRPGQALILTKPIGTGAIMAAAMQRKAQGRWIAGALESMQQSSRDAVQCLQRHGVSACTDVTGFGLLGHLVEMARPGKVALEIMFGDIPLLEGAKEVATEGVTSSLHTENARAVTHMISNPETLQERPHWTLLVDPQTAGGMLASVDAGVADTAVAELRQMGYPHAAIIGRVTQAAEDAQITIV